MLGRKRRDHPWKAPGDGLPWGASVDLDGGSLFNTWNADVEEAELFAEFSPKSYHAVLSPGASTTFGFCGSKGPDGQLPVIVERPEECASNDGPACDDGQYCVFEIGTCDVIDQSGSCAPVPDICTQQYDPVCGCDGETYSSACFAAAAGVNVDFEGPCEVTN